MNRLPLRYYLFLIPRYYVVGLPGVVLDLIVQWLSPEQVVDGFRIIDPRSETRSHFVSVVKSALSLIARYDLLRFKIVKAEIRSIVNAPAVLGASYERPLRVCAVDLRCFYDQNTPQTTEVLLASALIHEATFGHLISRGIIRTRANACRVDAFCCRQAHCFLRRLGMSSTPWDEQRLSEVSRAEFWRLAVHELREVFRRDANAEASIWKQVRRK